MPRVNYTDQVFKKTEQVVGRPAVTKENINDLYMKYAPQNRSESTERENEHKRYYAPGLTRSEKIADDARAVEEQLPTGAPDQTLGRMSKLEGLAEVSQDSVYSR